jgi:DNA polymerase-4
VRLLGAGLLNLEHSSARQGDLFDTQTEKTQRLEKTILDINKKFPEAALHRARGETTNHFS